MTFLTSICDLSIFVVEPSSAQSMFIKSQLKDIRKQSWQSTVPILMVSSESNQSRLAAVEQAGMSGVCDKPFEPAVVRGLFEKMLRTD